EAQGSVLDVVEVVFELVGGVFDAGAVRIVDLRPTGEARLHQVPLIVKRDFVRQLLDELGTLGPRTDERHFSAQDVPKLRHFVQAGASQNPAYASDATVMALGPLGSVFLGVGAHGTQFP